MSNKTLDELKALANTSHIATLNLELANLGIPNAIKLIQEESPDDLAVVILRCGLMNGPDIFTMLSKGHFSKGLQLCINYVKAMEKSRLDIYCNDIAEDTRIIDRVLTAVCQMHSRGDQVPEEAYQFLEYVARKTENLDLAMNTGYTLIVTAISQANIRATKLLIELGANLNIDLGEECFSCDAIALNLASDGSDDYSTFYREYLALRAQHSLEPQTDTSNEGRVRIKL